MKNFIKRFIYRQLLMGAAILLILPVLVYGQSVSVNLHGGKNVQFKVPQRGSLLVKSKNGQITSEKTEDDPNKIDRFIVTFTEQPIAKYLIKKSAQGKSSIQSVYS
jgi:hypothetical protein